MTGGGPTRRAAALAVAGAAALVASRGFGTPALATLGAGLLALPVLVTTVVWLAASGLRLERRLSPSRCRAGDRVEVSVRRLGWAARAGLDRLLDVGVDPVLDGAAAGVPRRAAGGWRLRAARGDHRLPPSRLVVRDPFGLARRERDGGGDDRLLVVPAAPPVEWVPAGSPAGGHGPRRRRPVSGFGELDRVREYRAGDPLSRVHWPQTAKRGRLQTKELRAPDGDGRSIVVLLDGSAAPGDDLETAVTAAAAIARRLHLAGEAVALAHTGRPPGRVPASRASWPALELELARVEGGGDRPPSLALAAEAAGPGAPEAVVVVSASADPGLATAVGRTRAAGVGVGIVLTGPAAAAAGELAGAGAEVVVVPTADRVAEALARPATPRSATA